MNQTTLNFTEDEQTVLRALAPDRMPEEAAAICGMARNTAYAHIRAMKRVAGVSTLHGLMLAAERAGMLKEDRA